MSELVIEISKLSILERLRLIQEIIKSIESDSVLEMSGNLTIAQENEIESRSAALENGELLTVSWQNVQAKIKQKYGI